jgi:hypothetical protein
MHDDMYSLAIRLLVEAQRIREKDFQGYMESAWSTLEYCAALILIELGYDEIDVKFLVLTFHRG